MVSKVIGFVTWLMSKFSNILILQNRRRILDVIQWTRLGKLAKQNMVYRLLY